jgi:hypothetical protein
VPPGETGDPGRQASDRMKSFFIAIDTSCDGSTANKEVGAMIVAVRR